MGIICNVGPAVVNTKMSKQSLKISFKLDGLHISILFCVWSGGSNRRNSGVRCGVDILKWLVKWFSNLDQKLKQLWNNLSVTTLFSSPTLSQDNKEKSLNKSFLFLWKTNWCWYQEVSCLHFSWASLLPLLFLIYDQVDDSYF